MAPAALLALLGTWLLLQATAGRLPGRLLSYRQIRPGEVPPAGPTVQPNAYTPGAAPTVTPAGMPTSGRLSIDDIARLALSVGLTRDQAAMATAIAMRESGGNLAAHNPVPPDDSYGLWQINRLAHPGYSPAELVTAEGNARAMLAISLHGTNWRPWSTYRGMPAGTLAAARQAVDRAGGYV